jgi:hypothetical protein
MLKSYTVFVDSDRGRTLKLHEQAPSGGVVRVSLKSLTVARGFSNLTEEQRESIKVAIAPIGSTAIQVLFNGTTSDMLPASVYLTSEDVINAVYDVAEAVVKAYDPAAVVTRCNTSGLDFANSTIPGSGNALFVIFLPIADPIIDTSTYPIMDGYRHIDTEDAFANGFFIRPELIRLGAIPHHVHLRTDVGPGHNLESPSLAGQLESSPHTDMHHSDILGSAALTRGENSFTWRAFIKDERCSDAQHSLQSLTLRLTDHRNNPLPDTVHVVCTLGVEVFIQHDIRQLGYGPAPSPVDPKDEKILLSLR